MGLFRKGNESKAKQARSAQGSIRAGSRLFEPAKAERQTGPGMVADLLGAGKVRKN